MIIESPFKPAWWLANAHAQTLYPTMVRREEPPIDYFERLELPDGDFIDLGWSTNGLSSNAPLVLLLHGLGGGIDSAYVPGLLRAFNLNGWRGVLMLFRGAGREPNRLPRAYHSGDTADLCVVLESLMRREPNTKKAIVGISLGGNVLLKWLGEQEKQKMILTGVAVSVPFQLRLAADRMNHGLSRFYQAYFLRKMRQVFGSKLAQRNDHLASVLSDLDKFRCFWTFDDHITAPMHGYANVHEYYREASSLQYLQKIKTPTLIIHALDDPFMVPEILPRVDDLSSEVTLELSQRGGHVGFIEGTIPGVPNYWLDERIPRHLQNYL